jgi:hypothetical protein
MRFLSAALLLTFITSLPAAEWSWEWPADGKAQSVKGEFTTFKYGKEWAYAVEIDDGPKWVPSFAVPFLANYTWTDAPPGPNGGRKRPFVGGVAVIAGAVESNHAAITWAELKTLPTAGWGILNHSFAHTGRDWGDVRGRMTDDQVREDAFWSQYLFAVGMDGMRAPTAAVYANGYTDYNRNGALQDVGIGVATRVGGSSSTDVTSPKLNWMDFPRNYLDEPVWIGDAMGDTLVGIPNAGTTGPAPNTLLIDFTHEIQRDASSPNQKRWKERLATIEQRWGASGSDNLWCAPTDEIADYCRAAKAAKLVIGSGKVTVALPDNLPGSSLTIRLVGIPADTKLAPPAGGVLHRQGDVVWLTTPTIGKPGAPVPRADLKPIYHGPAGSIQFPAAVEVACVMVQLSGNLEQGFSYKLSLQTKDGDTVLAEPSFASGWNNSRQLHALLPTREPIRATGFHLPAAPAIQSVTVWAVRGAR